MNQENDAAGLFTIRPKQWMFGPPNSDYNLVDNLGLGGRAVARMTGIHAVSFPRSVDFVIAHASASLRFLTTTVIKD
jgi:hypothetical protein